ncbi:MAG: GNAT family N-acetyltransferase [Tabrizicola sp.]|nr:GNAT family N-acetyltransferase [Tabrizicola sp.]
MIADDALYTLRLATTDEDVTAAQRLRYEVFVAELGGDGPLVDHRHRLERDAFDAHFDHLILVDRRKPTGDLDHVVGAYRVLPGERRAAAGRFYSETEYDLAPLLGSGRKLLELGRSCVHRDHRGGTAMLHLWNGLADYVLRRGIEILFGVASFHGTQIDVLAEPLSYLHHHHLAPPEMRVTARPAHRQEMALVPRDALDRKTAMAATPALIKAYLRLGGFVGDGAWIDREFNTTDVCLVMDTGQMSARHRDFYIRKKAQR